MKVPFKHKLLMWNGGHNILPTASFLATRIPNFDPTCPQCDRCPDSLLHMLRDCHVAKSVWGKILHYHQPKNVRNFFNLGWDDWIHFNCDQNDFWKVKFSTTFWHLWCSRNKAVFERAVNHPRFLYSRVMADFFTNIKAFQVNEDNSRRVGVGMRWKPPKNGFLKLNIDGAWKAEGDKSGIGGVFRDERGKWEFGFSKRIEAGSAEAAELLAIREGVQIAWDCNYLQVEVECDALGVVQLLSKPLEAVHHPLGVVVMDICILLPRKWKVEFMHIKREANKVAHALAAEAVQQKEERVVYITSRDHVKDVLSKDLEFVAGPSGIGAEVQSEDA